MDVFIGNLPPSITFNEIRWLHGNWGYDAEIECVDGQDKTGSVYRYFLARFSSEHEAEAGQLIKQLNGASYFGQRVEVREFVHRRYGETQERRTMNDRPWHGIERRRAERRKGAH